MDRRYLTEADVLAIRALPKPAGRGTRADPAENSLAALAAFYGVSKTAISEARSGRKWASAGPGALPVEMPGEEWRPVLGWEGRYDVSSLGRVRSVRQRRLMTPNANAGGYLVVSLHRGGKKTNRLVHRLVADAFLPADLARPRVNHIDGGKLNNAAVNLEWCTDLENTQHAIATGLWNPRKRKAQHV